MSDAESGGRKSRRSAFSLVELLVVVALSTLALTMVGIVWRGPIAAAKLRNSIESYRLVDSQVRRSCQSASANGQIQIALSTNGVVWQLLRTPVELHPSINSGIAELLLPTGDSSEVLVRFDNYGRSSSYAVRFQQGGYQKWLFFAGLSGQCFELDSIAQVRACFRNVRS